MITNRHILTLFSIIILIIVIFEASQQIFYVHYFNLNYQADFWSLFKSQSIKWIVWLSMSYFLIRFIRNLSKKNQLELSDLYKTFSVILLLILIDIFIISIINSLQSVNGFSWELFWKDSFVYFSFQKFPIYTLAYVCFAIILYFYFTNIKLQIDILEMDQLKQENLKLYSKINQTNHNNSKLLNIKVGNKQKIIPTNQINWFEADDYCVNVYTKSSPVYSIRMSLKTLEKKMPKNFLRVHRGAIVNMNALTEFSKNGINQITLIDGTIINVSKSRIKAVNQYISLVSN